MKCSKNYYNILGVTPDSDDEEIKSAYRKLARKFHPDVNKAPNSVQFFKDVLEAYETLSDQVKRKQYNMVNGYYTKPKFYEQNQQAEPKEKSDNKTELKNNFNSENRKNSDDNSNSAKKSAQTTAQRSAQTSARSSQNTSNDNLYREKFLRNSINSILDEITKCHSKKSNPPKNGTDIFAEVTIDIKEAVSGTERILNIMHKEACPKCHGHRFINGAKCSVCSGSGEYKLNKKITVKVPANIKNGAKLRILGEGNPGFFGGKNGNLYVTVKIENGTKDFITEGNDILYKLNISTFEAVLGAKITVPAPGGNITVTIPKMTHSGQKFRIANQGLQTNGYVGDMIITVEIQLPKSLSPNEVKMYEKLRKMSQDNLREEV